ncbi:hypothetical protein BU24DRAFT_101199 [Aaosphaeria arxii CBS 175.79]|uniref:Uncharacterized protein n=1 Tax=Aaosphaeria arxii CBS 175.79 TaxID=1450172 RepID=A0A6A5Y089_9PLEO|nr:uncharacterized protein BU24DRAFT_101199 [Aaosphaeria arxii CBS 175.79]KAF2018636.1 hypothetical protein BU24DRAFT_101199 [Aaosphaeria arxii CBS 175.79]
MHLKSLTVGIALTGGAVAQLSFPTDPVGVSVFSVLRTAIPPEVQVSAFQNPSSFGAEVASSISAGNPPAWYTGLPADVKSALPSLYPAAAVTTPSATPTSAASSSQASSASSESESASSSAATTSSPSSSSAASAAPSSSSTGGAAAPTAVVGAGLAGLMGVVGLLAL